MRYLCPLVIAALVLSLPVMAAADTAAAPSGFTRSPQPALQPVQPVAGPAAAGNFSTCAAGQECMTLAGAGAVYTEGSWRNGTAVCGYAMVNNRSVPEYCCNGTRKQAAGSMTVPAAATLPMDVQVYAFSTPAAPSNNTTTVASGSLPRRVPAIRKDVGVVDSFIGFFSGILTRPDCPPSLRACEKQCVDLQTDPANCGLCGYTCPSGAVCSSGECRVFGSP